jgi:HSP20 family molecular chaperone IbpA
LVLSVGPGINDAGIEAEASNGVLTVKVPKTEEARMREIPVR